MIDFLIRYEKAPLAWVLYRSDVGNLLYQQIADNGAISKEDPSSARDWATKIIAEEIGEPEFAGDYALYGPTPNEVLKVHWPSNR
jgi:hypothetical protein